MKKLYTMGFLITSLILSTSWALTPPKYLSVPHWKDCVRTTIRGSAEFICLPEKQPKKCPYKSWNTLKDEHLVDKCL